VAGIATGGFLNPDDTFLAYKEVRSFAVHGKAEPPVAPAQASDFERAVRETFDQHLTVAKERGFTKRRQLLQLLDDYEDRDELIAWIREHDSAEWGKYLDNITASPGLLPRLRAGGSTGLGMTCALLASDYPDGAPGRVSSSVSQAGSSASARYSNSPIGCSGVTASAAGYSPARKFSVDHAAGSDLCYPRVSRADSAGHAGHATQAGLSPATGPVSAP
jgi:hypothetical protein